MCLTVKHSYKPNEIIIEKCIKKLYIDSQQNFYTPFRQMYVNKNGIIAEKDGPAPKLYSSVYGEHIHAYVQGTIKFYFGRTYTNAVAYAINVKAHGMSCDLVCKFLYIPVADKTGNKKKRSRKLDKIIENPNWDEIRKLFPEYVFSFPTTDIKINWKNIFKTYDEKNIHEYHQQFLKGKMTTHQFLKRFRSAWRAHKLTLS